MDQTHSARFHSFELYETIKMGGDLFVCVLFDLDLFGWLFMCALFNRVPNPSTKACVL